MSDFTLIVNRKSKCIPSEMWQMIAAKPAFCAVVLAQPFGIVDAEGHEQHGNAGDYIVQMSGGPAVIVPAHLFDVLFNVLGGSA